MTAKALRKAKLTVALLLRIANGHIHDDKNNVLRLRSHMPKEALYKYVGNKINRHHMRMLPTDMNVAKDTLNFA